MKINNEYALYVCAKNCLKKNKDNNCKNCQASILCEKKFKGNTMYNQSLSKTNGNEESEKQ